MPDWGMLSSGVSSLSGITRSPWNPEWTVGGSSSGAGAAAAAGFGAVHFGTDIGGSVRLPAAWTGVATLNPSNGRIPLDNPYFGRSAGPLARTVADVALGMHAVARPDERDYTSLPDAQCELLGQEDQSHPRARRKYDGCARRTRLAGVAILGARGPFGHRASYWECRAPGLRGSRCLSTVRDTDIC